MSDNVTAAPAVESPYLTCAEAAAYLRTTVQGVYARVKRGRLAPLPGSGRLLFTRDELDAHLRRKPKPAK